MKTEGWQYEADVVILACGSKAAQTLGGCEDGYHLAEKLGHPVTEIVPALVPLKTKEAAFHALAGLRSPAKVTLFLDGKRRLNRKENCSGHRMEFPGLWFFRSAVLQHLGF